MLLRRIRKEVWDVLATCTDRGECSLLDFLAGLEGTQAKQASRMLAVLTRVAAAGPPRSADKSHRIDGEIWELIHGDLRVLWFYDDGSVVICTHGFVKKSQRTPRLEIERARAQWAAYGAARRRGSIRIEEVEE